MAKNKKQKKKSLWYSITESKNVTEKEYMKNMNRISMFIAVAFGVSFAVFIVIAWIGGINTVIDTILGSKLDIYSLAFLFVFSGFLIRFVKWSYYLRTLKIHVPFRKSLIIYLSLYSMNITPGMAGRVLVAFTLNRVTKSKIASTLPIVTFDIFTDFIGVAIVALATAIYFNTYMIYVLILDAVLITPYLFILNGWFYRVIRNRLGKSRWFLRLSLYGDEYFASQSKLNKPMTYIVSIATSVPAAFFNSLALFFALMAIGIMPHVLATTFIQTSAQVFGAVTALPGNIGVTDGVLVALLGSMIGIGTAKSSAVTIMSRLATLWFGVGVGGGFLIYSMRYWRVRKTHDKNERKAGERRRRRKQ